MRVRLFAPLGVLTLLAAAGLLATAPPAGAAGETVNVWLTTTDDAAGRHVVRGLQQQTPLTFGTPARPIPAWPGSPSPTTSPTWSR
jgi:glucosylceramidase